MTLTAQRWETTPLTDEEGRKTGTVKTENSDLVTKVGVHCQLINQRIFVFHVYPQREGVDAGSRDGFCHDTLCPRDHDAELFCLCLILMTEKESERDT